MLTQEPWDDCSVCSYLLSIWNASSHSLLILLRRAELELVLNRPSDLRLRPNEVFWLLIIRWRFWDLTKLETIIHRATDGADVAGLLGHALEIKQGKPQHQQISALSVNLLGDTLLHQVFDTLLHIPDKFLLLLLHTDHPTFLHCNMLAIIWNLYG